MIDYPDRALHLDCLATDVPVLTRRKAFMLAEACTWCLLECRHENGVTIRAFDELGEDSYSIFWADDTDASAIERAYNEDDAIEFGAEALALLLVLERTPFNAIRRSARGTGIDYWLGYKTDDPNLVFCKDDARLEVSGILKERPSNTVKSRIQRKLNQTKPTDDLFPAYIVVVEFSRPSADMVFKNVNGK